MKNIPVYISIVFILTTFLMLFLLYKASGSKKIIILSIAWLLLQSIVGLSGFYTKTNRVPPTFVLLIGPPVLAIFILFSTRRGRTLLDTFDQKWLTYISIIRVPVEIILFWLFIQKMIPQLMTFEGRNLDILSGITAPLVAYFGYSRRQLGKPILLGWNFICLGLLLNIVTIAILSAPSAFQQFAFAQPNIAILYFPFVWLPCFIVPVVLLSHLATIRALFKHKTLSLKG